MHFNALFLSLSELFLTRSLQRLTLGVEWSGEGYHILEKSFSSREFDIYFVSLPDTAWLHRRGVLSWESTSPAPANANADALTNETDDNFDVSISSPSWPTKPDIMFS